MFSIRKLFNRLFIIVSRVLHMCDAGVIGH